MVAARGRKEREEEKEDAGIRDEDTARRKERQNNAEKKRDAGERW